MRSKMKGTSVPSALRNAMGGCHLGTFNYVYPTTFRKLHLQTDIKQCTALLLHDKLNSILIGNHLTLSATLPGPRIHESNFSFK